MTLSASDRDMLNKRGTLLNEAEQGIIELAFSDLAFRAGHHGIPLANDDRLAKLEAAFVRYLLESRPGQLVRGFHTVRNVIDKGPMETLYIVRIDETVACSEEHAYDPANFTGAWKWRERTDLSPDNVYAIATFVGNYSDPTR